MYRMRSSVHSKLMKAQKLGKKDKSLADALALLERLQDEDEGSFSLVELAAFHHVRGIVRIQANDYHGALDDLRIVQRMSISRESTEGIAETILLLEKTLGLEPDSPFPANPSKEDGDDLAGGEQ